MDTSLYLRIGGFKIPYGRWQTFPCRGKRFAYYQSLDATQGRLYIAHMNTDRLVVFDVKKNEVVANPRRIPQGSRRLGRSRRDFTKL